MRWTRPLDSGLSRIGYTAGGGAAEERSTSSLSSSDGGGTDIELQLYRCRGVWRPGPGFLLEATSDGVALRILEAWVNQESIRTLTPRRLGGKLPDAFAGGQCRMSSHFITAHRHDRKVADRLRVNGRIERDDHRAARVSLRSKDDPPSRIGCGGAGRTDAPGFQRCAVQDQRHLIAAVQRSAGFIVSAQAAFHPAGVKQQRECLCVRRPQLLREKRLGDECAIGGAEAQTLQHAGSSGLREREREAQELLRNADDLRGRIRSSALAVRLRVGYAPSLASGIMSAALADFSKSHPGAQVELLDLTPVEMLSGLETNKIDIALLAASGAKSRGFTWHHLLSTEWRLAVSRRHPLARRQRISPANAAKEPLLVFNRRDYPGYWGIVTTWLRRHRLRPEIAGEYDGAESLIAAVESSLGVALVTTRTMRHFVGRVQFKNVMQAPAAVAIAAVCREERTGEKPLALFIESLRQAAKKFA